MTVEREQVKTAPPEKSAIKTLTDGIKKLASGFIKHSPSAETDNTFFIELKAVMEEMDESQRRELQPVADVFLQACRERRENEMYDKMLASLERRYPGMPGMMLTSYESWNHVSKESARPQPEEAIAGYSWQLLTTPQSACGQLSRQHPIAF